MTKLQQVTDEVTSTFAMSVFNEDCNFAASDQIICALPVHLVVCGRIFVDRVKEHKVLLYEKCNAMLDVAHRESGVVVYGCESDAAVDGERFEDLLFFTSVKSLLNSALCSKKDLTIRKLGCRTSPRQGASRARTGAAWTCQFAFQCERCGGDVKMIPEPY